MSESIPKHTRAEQQARKDQGIAVDHPLQALKRAMEIVLQSRECHIDDGCIENDHEEPKADGSQSKGMKRLMLVIWPGRGLSFSEHTFIALCWLCKRTEETTAHKELPSFFMATDASDQLCQGPATKHALKPCH
jgi:hypothetical protein